ncbi:hypothetical protein [Amaricoccus solimangrovi]|uniref:Uncharacterized protein n=1 Tax=Amaricoccus solimangrovi TaxID=2589815 RepID=A0A501W711_9RHOB|nr:hypothetical protein [Amaricoccus solimangrovi]TPE45078.1 hypothetical protein FJM51_22785 [Amaricoccus solimangrovi]
MTIDPIPDLVAPFLSPTDAAIAEAAIGLIAKGEFSTAATLLRSRTADREEATLRAFQTWYDLPRELRPPFWEWRAERRRDAIQVLVEGGAARASAEPECAR